MAFLNDTSSGLDGGGSTEAAILHVQSSDFVVVANRMSLYPNTNVIAVDTPSRRRKSSSPNVCIAHVQSGDAVVVAICIPKCLNINVPAGDTPPRRNKKSSSSSSSSSSPVILAIPEDKLGQNEKDFVRRSFPGPSIKKIINDVRCKIIF